MLIREQWGPLGVCQELDNRAVREKAQGFVHQDDHNRDGHGDGGKSSQKQDALNDAFRQVTSCLVGETGRFLVHWRGIPVNLLLSGKRRMLGVNYDNSMTTATDLLRTCWQFNQFQQKRRAP